jgi:hypothetical protein
MSEYKGNHSKTQRSAFASEKGCGLTLSCYYACSFMNSARKNLSQIFVPGLAQFCSREGGYTCGANNKIRNK